jgi:hypothetical protein
VHRSRHVSVLQEIFNRQDQAWEGLIADDQHLFNVKIKVLMRDDIAKTHGSIPVDMGITILKQSSFTLKA